MRFQYILFPLSMLLTAACGPSAGPSLHTSPPKGGPIFGDGSKANDTASVATADLFPSMSAISNENGIRVVAALLYDPGHFLTLGAGDTLTATVGGVTTMMQREPNDDKVHYVATFPKNDAVTSVVVSFMRTGGQPSAPNNVLSFAPAFEYQSPPTTAHAEPPGPFANPIVVKVAPAISSKSTLHYHVTGPCVPPLSSGADEQAFSDDTSAWLLDMNAILDPVARDCALAIELRAETQGTWDPAFNTDSSVDVFAGVQARSFAMTWNPTTTH